MLDTGHQRDDKSLSWLGYWKPVLAQAGREFVAILKKQAVWNGLLILAAALVGFLLGQPADGVAGVFIAASATLALVVFLAAAWCLAWAPVNLQRSSLAENRALQRNLDDAQRQLDEQDDTVAIAITELERTGHLEHFRIGGKEFIQGTSVLYSGFNNDGIRDLLAMKLIETERIPNPPKPLEPLPPGAFRTGYTEPPYHTLHRFTDLGLAVWKKIKEDATSA